MGVSEKGSKKWVHRAIRLESGVYYVAIFVSMYVVCYIYSHVNQYLTIYSKYTTVNLYHTLVRLLTTQAALPEIGMTIAIG